MFVGLFESIVKLCSQVSQYWVALHQLALMEIVINKLYISVDGTVYVIIITAINIVTLFDFLLLLVPQLRLNSESGSKINAIAAMGHP